MRLLLAWLFIGCLCSAQSDENALVVHSERAREAQQKGDFKTAALEWQALVKLLPNAAEAQSNLGMMWHFDQEYPSAIKAFLQAATINPDLVAPHLFLGIDYYLTSRPAEAISQLTKALKLDSRNGLAMKWLGMSYSQIGKFEKAISLLNLARGADPNDPDLLFSLSRTYTKLLFQSYETIRSLDRNSPFLKGLQANTTTMPESTSPLLADMRSNPEGGQTFRDFLRLSDLVRRDPRKTEYWYGIGKCSAILALGYLDDFLARSPGSYRIHQLRAEYFLAVNDEQQAIGEYREALSTKPDAVQLHADVGNIFMVHHEYEQAIRQYQAELEVNPYSLLALERIGEAYIELHNADSAANYLQRAISINPTSFEALRALGQVCYQRGDYRQAAVKFHAALAAKPEGDSTVLYHLVQTYRKLGKMTEAQRWSAELQDQLAKDLKKSQHGLDAAASESAR